MSSTRYIDAFVPAGKEGESCINCGICLQKCPVMQMDKSESRAAIKRLLDGEDAPRVLNECTLCFSCNHYCPKGLKPYALIIERMAAKNREKGSGIPEGVQYLFTRPGAPGYFFDLYKAGSDEDKAILERWAQVPAGTRDTLFVGCFGRSIPQSIEYSRALSGLAKFAPRDACCGEIPYRFGDYETFGATVEHTRKQLEALDTERLVCYCGSCNNFLGNIWPNFHGVHLPFEVISIWDWLWEKLQASELAIERRFEKTVVLNDACYSSELGDGFYAAVRGLHSAAGMTVVEPANTRYDALCCGFAASLRNNYDQRQSAMEAQKRVDQIVATRVADVSCYCPGCYASLNNFAAEKNLTVHYALSRILWALGDDRPPAR